ncbi:Interleukin-10 [Varanus komodoensis]|uniref:Interleukin family protein n=1 Tax=Varanus komodoensis TaxID=61221 RepID=A0A8D2JL09_VARKO|nr:interleukin-10 [Varanus komodoensis]KAF7254567.1 Interleukin-10 [Varanus komodoensis]
MKSPVAFTLLFLVISFKNAHLQFRDDCKHFADNLPRRLRELRATFNKVKDYFQSRDDELDILLLKEDLLEDFKGYLGCQSVAEMIQFYLEDVLPNVTTSNTVGKDVGFLGNMLLDLRQTIKRCHRFFICERKNKAIKNIKETYKKLHVKGIYKAMGEFDIFIDYIEEYLRMKMRN